MYLGQEQNQRSCCVLTASHHRVNYDVHVWTSISGLMVLSQLPNYYFSFIANNNLGGNFKTVHIYPGFPQTFTHKHHLRNLSTNNYYRAVCLMVIFYFLLCLFIHWNSYVRKSCLSPLFIYSPCQYGLMDTYSMG